MRNIIKIGTVAVTLSVCALAASAASLQSSMTSLENQFRPISAKTVQLVPLQHGFTLHKYEDGKMAVENEFGRPTLMKDGQVLTAANGTQIKMVGNEVARLRAEQLAVNHR
jgi:hypothetical protein